eukprot:951392-Rhodomonas_salina.1
MQKHNKHNRPEKHNQNEKESLDAGFGRAPSYWVHPYRHLPSLSPVSVPHPTSIALMTWSSSLSFPI